LPPAGAHILSAGQYFPPDVLKIHGYQSAANIADTMNRIAVLGNGIKRISSPQKPIMAGFACRRQVLIFFQQGNISHRTF
jgi:hypothetical protein